MMKLIEFILKLLKRFGNLTSIIVGFLSGMIRQNDLNIDSILIFGNIYKNNLFHISSNSYICQEFESLAFIGNCRTNLVNVGDNLINIKQNAANNAAFLHLFN